MEIKSKKPLKISIEEIKFHPRSVFDLNGKVFWWNNQIYRGITQKNSELYKKLFARGIIENLVQKKLLVETHISNFEIDGYELVLKHCSIPFISYPHEWCDVMFKEVALRQIELLIELNQYSLTSRDATTLNFVFDGNQAIFIDFCSIVPANKKSRWSGSTYQEYCCLFIEPLKIMSRGYRRIATSIIKDNYYTSSKLLQNDFHIFNSEQSLKSKLIQKINQKIDRIFQNLRRNTPVLIRPLAKRGFLKVKNTFSSSLVFNENWDRAKFLQTVKREVENISLPALSIKSYNCYDNFFSSLKPSANWTQKQISYQKILSTFQPKSVLDVDSDRGWYAQLAASNGSKVVAFDDDEACVRQLYADAKQKNLYIIPLLLDFCSFTYNTSNEYFISIDERLKCDMVIALTLFQHLLLKHHFTLDKALNRLSNLSNHWLLIEYITKSDLAQFIPPQNQFSRDRWEQSLWYSLEEFISILNTKFDKVHSFPSESSSKTLLLCEKRIITVNN